ncbi:hypothetical protein BDY21DRAFT_360514 [Lineolata rhizophorae]|uniref:DUF7598 domain-containing protein n=1 Tax=Lineolata rhizophorae TaxID=578093 RepID=A0A6A6PBP2_9PEZI|nr:hypothetical protein BDY21DRAFT_360514 [Lineolata rhizophorae]
MGLSAKSLAGPGYIILNTLRAMNIIALLSVVAASFVMLIRPFIVNQFFFFDACSHVFTGIFAMFLIVSETPIARRYFERNWPLFSPNHGFVALGVAMIVLGINVLGNLNKETSSQQNMGLAFWRLVVASGIMVFILGVFNITASYVFRDSRNGISARRVRSHGAVAVAFAPDTESGKPGSIKTTISPSNYSQRSYSPMAQQPARPWHDRKTFSPIKTLGQALWNTVPGGSGHDADADADADDKHGAAAAADNVNASANPNPNVGNGAHGYSPAPYPRTPDSHLTKKSRRRDRMRESLGIPRRTMEISAPTNVNPQFAHLVRQPDPAHHPSARKPEGDNWL